MKCEDENLKGSSVFGEFKKRKFFKTKNYQVEHMNERIEAIQQTLISIDQHHKQIQELLKLEYQNGQLKDLSLINDDSMSIDVDS